MDPTITAMNAKIYEDFLRDCKLVEEDTFPRHDVEIVWPHSAAPKSEFLQLRPVRLVTTTWMNQKSGPYLDLNWVVDLELLAVTDDGTMSENIHVPLENARSRALTGIFPAPQQADSTAGPSAPSPSGTESKIDRLKAVKDGISRRVRGLRSGEHNRSLVGTLQSSAAQVSQYVLVAVIKWTGPSEGGFSIVSTTLTVGGYQLSTRGPVSPQLLASNVLVLDSSSTPDLAGRYYYRRPVGVMDLAAWTSLADSSLFQKRGRENGILQLTLQLNEQSMPRIGFPFAQLIGTNKAEFDERISLLQTHVPSGGYVTVQGTDDNTYFLSKDSLTELSAFFRTYLTDNWEHGTGDRSIVHFPLVPLFTTCPDLIPLIVYFFERRAVSYGLSENAADLIAAADVLGMPELMRLAEIATIANITRENVTRLIRLAWQFQAGRLFRAALIFLRANYDEIWVDNRDDLADLGKLLSSPRFLKAFKDMSFTADQDGSGQPKSGNLS